MVLCKAETEDGEEAAGGEYEGGGREVGEWGGTGEYK